MNIYNKISEFWDEVFSLQEVSEKKSVNLKNDRILNGIKWLCDGVESIIDFGCGNGSLIFQCNQYGTKKHIGIDISKEAIKCTRSKVNNELKKFDFRVGGIEELKKIESQTMDGAILSNILDNLAPVDSLNVIKEIYRILKVDGKVIIKLNEYVTKKEIEDLKIRIIENNFLDDGLYLWNLKTEDWINILKDKFVIESYQKVYYEEYDQNNRLFCLIKK